MKKLLLTCFAALVSFATFGAAYNYQATAAEVRQYLADPETSGEFKCYYNMRLKQLEEPAAIDTWAKFNQWCDDHQITPNDGFKGWYALSFDAGLIPDCYAHLTAQNDPYAIHFLLSDKARKKLNIAPETVFTILTDEMIDSDIYNPQTLTTACNVLAQVSLRADKEFVIDRCRLLYAKYLPKTNTKALAEQWSPVISQIVLIAKGRGVDITK